MSKIILKNYDELIVADEVIDMVNTELEAARSKEFPLNHYPIAINHADGMWCGSLSDISSISSSNKSIFLS